MSFWMSPSTAASIPEDIRPRAFGVNLRILAIGDSITFGAPDPGPYNSYRKSLLKMLTDRGNTVDFVGSLNAGDFDNNLCEGHRGKVISEISDMSAVGIYAAPNLVLVHAGTNDCNRPYYQSTAPGRLSDMIGHIFDHSNDAVILVARIIPSSKDGVGRCITKFNTAVPGVVDSWQKKNKNVFLVDMETNFSLDNLADGLHPNPQGYQIMAERWMSVIDEQGHLITKAPKSERPPYAVPDHCPGQQTWVNKGEIAGGASAAHPDPPFQQTWDKVGTFSMHECNPKRLFFPDLDGDGFGDWACVQADKGVVLGYLQVPVNGKPGNKWAQQGIIATGGDGRNSSDVFFADLDGDGRDDYIYVNGGRVEAWINGGRQADGGWSWNYIGIISDSSGATRENLQMVDIDGDDRADFLIVNQDTGEVNAWLNGGVTSTPEWRQLGVIATGRSKTANDIVVMGDFTGNGLADYMLVGQQGKVTGAANQMLERGLIPSWATKVVVAGGPSGATQEQVRLTDVNGDGKVDYILVDKNGGTQLWLNTDKFGRWQKGNGLFLADLDGDGASDYIWMDGSANILGYLNQQNGTNVWNNRGQIRSSAGTELDPSTGTIDLRLVRWAQLTKSGRADYIVLDEAQGAAIWSQNLGSPGNGWQWAPFATLATGPKHSAIAPPYNWRWDSKRVQFADLTGDGLADYLYVNTNGAVLMWQTKGTDPPTWGPPQLVAAGPKMGVIWDEIRFADTDGRGVCDYLAVDRFTGRTFLWRNEGVQADGSIRWTGLQHQTG